ncbi:hypothetical protein [Mycolicibacterium conceptionense]|uniref:hypothetical protein n=1 Tax=Mycolicibacterium conceptionense TaxID=451644 RepID=UPI00096BE6B2|nr:hypothetical protein [Mycolicibacterium conceptionense]OMB79025.1 hypothetical protein A5743_14745 [Mycolicibacterium conceptionense]
MSTSVRTYLVAGAAAATATAIALTPVQAAPADIAVPAHPTSAQPELTQAMIDLLAAASRMTAAVAPKISSDSGAAPALGFAPAAAVTGDVAVQNAASDWLANTYNFVMEWVDWAVYYGIDLAYWVGQWVPFVSPITDQVDIFYTALIRPIANAFFLTFLVPVVNDPLNLGVWINAGGAAITQSIQAAINFGVAEFNEFFGWILPPLPPPFPTVATTQTLAAAAPGALFPGLRELAADVVLPPADFVTNAAVNTIDGAYGLVHNAANFVVDGAENAFDALRLGFISRQIDINYALISALSQQGVDLTTDLIKVPDSYLHNVLVNGEGPIRALGTEARNVVNSFVSHGSSALDAVGDYVDAQINYFTPGKLATDTKEVTSVPPSARASLLSAPAPAETPAKGDVATDSGTDTVAGTLQDRTKDRTPQVRSRVQPAAKDALTTVKKAGDDARDAVSNTVRNLTPKPKPKATPKVHEKASTASGSQSADKGKSASAKKDKK